MRSAALSCPVVATRSRIISVAALDERRRRQQTREEVLICVVPELAGPDRRRAGDKNQGIVLRQLQDLAGGQERPGRLLLGERHVREEEREALA